jgi:hypothetical protein
VYHLSSRRIGWRITQGDCNPCEARSNYHGIRGIINMLPVDRALAIYGTIANRSELQGTRDRLSQHLWKVFMEGEHDPHRLTVHGLAYLQNLDRQRDS